MLNIFIICGIVFIFTIIYSIFSYKDMVRTNNNFEAYINLNKKTISMIENETISKFADELLELYGEDFDDYDVNVGVVKQNIKDIRDMMIEERK